MQQTPRTVAEQEPPIGGNGDRSPNSGSDERSPIGGGHDQTPNSDGPRVGDALDGAIDRLDRPGNPFHVDGKAGPRAVRMDIDEPKAVGAGGISPEEARSRAMDVNNRQFLDPATNQRTKYLGTDTHPASGTTPEVSVAEDPNALLSRRFGEITEMRNIFNEALASIQEPGKLSPTALKKAINNNIWSIIKTGTSESAVRVRIALHELGFENVRYQGYVMRVR